MKKNQISLILIALLSSVLIVIQSDAFPFGPNGVYNSRVCTHMNSLDPNLNEVYAVIPMSQSCTAPQYLALLEHQHTTGYTTYANTVFKAGLLDKPSAIALNMSSEVINAATFHKKGEVHDPKCWIDDAWGGH